MEDILFGQRRSYHQLGKYPPYVRRSDMAQMLSEDKLLAWPYADFGALSRLSHHFFILQH